MAANMRLDGMMVLPSGVLRQSSGKSRRVIDAWNCYMCGGWAVGWVELLRNPSTPDDGFRKTPPHPTRIQNRAVRPTKNSETNHEQACYALARDPRRGALDPEGRCPPVPVREICARSVRPGRHHPVRARLVHGVAADL